MKKRFIGYPAVPMEDAGDFYRASDVDDAMAGASIALNNAKTRIRELEQQLAGANATIALFMGPDGEQHIERFAAAVRSLMESVTK